jgi:hypothetical protein
MYFSYLNPTTNTEKCQIATHDGYHVSAKKKKRLYLSLRYTIVLAGFQNHILCKIQKEGRKGKDGRTF